MAMRITACVDDAHLSLIQTLRQSLGSDIDSLDLSVVAVASMDAFRSAFDVASERRVSRETLVVKRGRLSREIGKVKKAGEDAAYLIAEVAELSASIKALDTEVDACLDHMARLYGAAAGAKADAADSRLCPGYLQSASRSPEALLQLTIIEDASDEVWNAYVHEHPRATCYHDVRWKRLIEDTFGHDTHYLSARDAAGELRGVLPLVHLSSRLFGSFMVSMPFFNYGGPLSDHVGVDAALMEAATYKARQKGCEHVEIRETFPRNENLMSEDAECWPAKTTKVSMVLPLPDSEAQLDAEFSAKLRSQTRRASKAGAEAFTGGLDLLDDFYRVFARNMRDLGTPVYPKCFFENILTAFTDEAFLTVVYLNSRPVAAGFLISHGKTLEIPWASSLREANATSVNMMLYRHILGEAIRRGYEYFDFGRSSKEAPTHRFKRQWGAVEHPLHWHYWLAEGDELPGLSPDNAKYRAIIRAWQVTPVWVTNRVGPMLVKYLP